MSISSKLSLLLYSARMAHGYTQAEVAEAVSISPRWYQRIESGTRMPGTSVLLRLILFLDIDVEEFREEIELFVPVSTLQGGTPLR